MRIGIDIMGGDFYPYAPVQGAIRASKRGIEDLHIVLVGNSELAKEELSKAGLSENAFEILDAPEVILMSEHPAKAVTQKPNSSIVLGLSAVKSGKLDGFISAGNTGAMLVASVLILGTIPGVTRPTIAAVYPHEDQFAVLCDVGANADCKPEHLLQFGLLCSTYLKSVKGMSNPRVALLNVGEEKTKGNQAAQAAHILFENNSQINFIGNAEGRDLNKGFADIYICDGFTGNILLKYAESFYDLMKEKIKEDPIIQTFNFENYGGLPILGVNGISLIGHGIATPVAFENMIIGGLADFKYNLTQKIEQAFASFT
jgi:glycerol-3-phosphate acyltransferase PlsX